MHSLSDPDKVHPYVSQGADATYMEGRVFEMLTIMDNNSLEDSYRQKYSLACLDGPIYNIKDLDNASFEH